MAHLQEQLLPQEQDFFMTDVDNDLSILDALCGIDGEEPGDEGLSDDDDDDSYDAQGVRKKKRARRSRSELNEIEKQRTRRINEQIQSLRALLEMSGLSTKKDKFSILRNTGEYIKKLKSLLNKSQAQLQTLLQARKQQMAQQQQQAMAPRPLLLSDPAIQHMDEKPTTTLTNFEPSHTPYSGPMKVVNRPPITTVDMVENGLYAPNKNSVDYSVMFKNASIAMAVASLDGKFVDCNCAFSVISGYSTDEILKRSVFDLTPPEDCQELMSIVGKMMESPAESAKHFWKRCCFENRDCYCFVSMWLVRRTSGEPVFFQCAVLPLEDYPTSIRTAATEALPEGTSAAPTATMNAQGQRTIEAAPSDVVSGVQELLNPQQVVQQQGERVPVRNGPAQPAPQQQQQQTPPLPPQQPPLAVPSE